MTDYWLLKHFPGRTLEELDLIDWGRLLRAVAVGKVMQTEALRDLGIAEPDRVTPDQWEEIQKHDELLERVSG